MRTTPQRKKGLERLIAELAISCLGAYVLGARLDEVYRDVVEQYRFLPENGQFVANPRTEKTAANQFLTDFPETLQGASAVWKYEVPAARYCLVQVRQKHGNPFYHKGEQKDEELRSVQYDIYQILETLRQTRGITKVYAENYLVEQQQDVEKDFHQARVLQTQCSSPGQKNREEWKRCQEFKKIKVEEFGDSGNGAAAVMAYEGKMEVYPAESMEVRTEWALWDILFRNGEREDYLLKLIAQKDDPVAVTVYGALHDFGDNIVEWNERHPDQKFSLIEIMPEALERVM